MNVNETPSRALITKVIVVAFMLTLSVCVAGLIFSL